MGLFDPTPITVVHATLKRSWWDGGVTALCGQRFPAGTYEECWFHGGVTCPTCKQAKKQHRQ